MKDITENTKIKKLSSMIFDLQSFEYQSFVSAKKICEYEGFVICFDALSLVIYNHNLSKDDFRDLCICLKELSLLKLSGENQKKRREYSHLLQFSLINPELFGGMLITKCNRPDFELGDQNEKIGIELYEMTDRDDSVLARITNDYFGKGYTAEEIRLLAKKKHGNKAEMYSFHNLNDTVGIASPSFNVDSKKLYYAKKLVDKYNLYNDKFEQYKKFIILAYSESINVCSGADADDVVNLAKGLKPDMKGFSYIIMYNDDDGKDKYKEYFFNGTVSVR